MTTMTITLPESTKEFAEAQARHEGFASVDAYLDAVLREVQLREARRKLEAKLIEGIESGPAVPMTREDWESIKREALERLQAERNRA